MKRRVAYFWEESGDLSMEARCNPYAPLLARGLESEGYELVDTPYAVSDEELRKRLPDHPVLHLNWLHRFYRGKSPQEARGNALAFMKRLSMAREDGHRIVWTLHNLYPHERPFPDLDHEVRVFVAQIADAIIVHCQHAADEMRRLFEPASKIHIIPVGNFIDAYPNTVSREDARVHLGVPQDAFVYLNFGRAKGYKGLETLVETFRALPEPDARLLLMMRRGRMPAERRTLGGTLRSLRRRLRGRTETAEYVDRLCDGDPRISARSSLYFGTDEFQYFLNAADVVVLPYSKILTSSTAVHAVSFGKPVIMPRLGCLPELIDDDMGILYSPDDPDGLAQAMSDIRERDVAQAGRRAFERARQLDWKDIGRATARVYDGLLEPRSGTRIETAAPVRASGAPSSSKVDFTMTRLPRHDEVGSRGGGVT